MRPFVCLFLAIAACASLHAADDYTLGADSKPNPDVPHGDVTEHEFAASKIYPDTHRKYWVYVPKQYDAAKPASLMVFQDGGGYVKADGQFRTPVVLDNLIARNELPVIVAIFVDPGSIPAGQPGAQPRSNRSFEYDSVGDAYSRFLIDEFLPEATKGLNISANPDDHAIAGISSGGVCAFTVAWERPEYFHRVMSHVGSFTNIRGGYIYPALIRKSKDNPKPLRVFLQDGANDLDNLHGDWPLSNQDMAAALQYAHYDVKFEFGDGGHNGKHGGVILPESLKWLWRPMDKPANDQPKS